MTNGKKLPQNPHIDYLRKEAKQRFAELKQRATGIRLADAQFGLAREYGFADWRALKDEVLRRMGLSPQRSHHPARKARFTPVAPTVDEELEADGYFQRGAATMGIGVTVGVMIIAIMLLLVGHAFGQTPQAPDTSPHKVLMVTVADGVQLEVLDWGGNGRPLVLLAGLGATAHDFDGFAPRFIAGHHVLAITRRGFGASSRPAPDPANYDAARLGSDVLAVMEALELKRPVLAGHSLAGQELSWMGAMHPEKVAGVVYLDAAYALAYYAPGNLNPVNANLTMDINSLRRKIQALPPLWQVPPQGVAAVRDLKDEVSQLQADLQATEAALRQWPPGPPMPSAPPGAPPSMQARINGAIQQGAEKFGALKLPVLAIFASPHAPPPNAPSPAMLDYFRQVESRSGNAELIARYKAGNPAAKVVVIPDAQHAVFKSHADRVAQVMESFMAGVN